MLCIPAIEDVTKFCVIDDNSDETDWKKIDIWSEFTRSGKETDIAVINLRNSSNKRGKSKTNDCSWTYINGINHVNIAAPTIINIEKARIADIDSDTLYEWIFFWSPTSKYATTILIINGVKIEAKRLNSIKTNAITKENITVSSLLNIRLNKLFKCFIIVPIRTLYIRIDWKMSINQIVWEIVKYWTLLIFRCSKLKSW